MSVSACAVSSLTYLRSAVSFLHHTDSVTTTPFRALSLTRALAASEPRSLKMRTLSPSRIERAAASAGWISRLGSFASAMAKGILAKDELRKWRLGGEMIAKGYRLPSTRVHWAPTRGGGYGGGGSLTLPFSPLP